jgi:DNA-binding HxlR family transcriptional regulator
MERRFTLGRHGKQLWTREKAREVRAVLDPLLDHLSAGDVLVVDTKGVEVFDYSFANEFFGNIVLSLARQYPGRFVVVEHLTKYTRENLAKALEGMNLAMIGRKAGELELIGKQHPADKKTFAAIARAAGPLTAAQLSERLKVNLNAMNERLTKLTNLGLVRRDKTSSSAGREQYEYRVLS